jgi:predicted small lipoprotein YifL
MRMIFTFGQLLVFRSVLVLMAFTLITGCGKKKEKPQAAPSTPPAHANGNTGTPLEVVKGVEQGKWKAVKIGITDRQMNRDLICTVDVGSSVTIPETGLVIRVHNFLPHFQMQGRKVLSMSNKLKNPAAFITITDNDRKNDASGKPLELQGYLFSRYPNTALNHPRYNFVLLDFIPTP